MVVTAVTYIYSPDLVVRFGILHFLGVSAIIYALAGKAIDALPGFFTARRRFARGRHGIYV